ncbi:MAG: aminoacyl-histidine dipeptidase [Acidobacteriota bacterium]
MTFVSELDPTALWRHFDRILEIPRGSKKEEQMRRHVIEVAEARGLEHATDDAGNLVVRVPGTAGREDAAITILQSHLDMVQEKRSDLDFDFDTDAIQPVADGDHLTADGTTLGADNGVGVATMMALMTEDGIPHGPLELLFTIDEETGLTGAAELATNLLTGRRLINLDSEEEGTLCIGCAGGAGNTLYLPVERAAVPADRIALVVEMAGLKGGHSGVDIHLQRGNAVKLLGRALAASPVPLRLAAFDGGSSHNAIPREAVATVILAPADRPRFEDVCRAEGAAIAAELQPGDPGATVEISEASLPAEAWTAGSTARAIQLVQAIPTGVMAMSFDLPDLVETSSTLATAHEVDGRFQLLISTRSSVASASLAQVRRIGAIAELAGAENVVRDGYPGWKPDPASPILQVLARVYEQVRGEAPDVRAVHAGLETGIIGEKYPGMDMVSFGPTIEFPHSPDERVNVPSVERYWKVLTAALDELS